MHSTRLWESISKSVSLWLWILGSNRKNNNAVHTLEKFNFVNWEVTWHLCSYLFTLHADGSVQVSGRYCRPDGQVGLTGDSDSHLDVKVSASGWSSVPQHCDEQQQTHDKDPSSLPVWLKRQRWTVKKKKKKNSDRSTKTSSLNISLGFGKQWLFFFFNQPNNEAMNQDRNSGVLKMCCRFELQYAGRYNIPSELWYSLSLLSFHRFSVSPDGSVEVGDAAWVEFPLRTWENNQHFFSPTCIVSGFYSSLSDGRPLSVQLRDSSGGEMIKNLYTLSDSCLSWL